MGYEAYVTIAVVLLALLLFITEYLSVDHIAISIIVVLVLTGVLTPDEAVDGFANNAVITVAAMFVLSDSLLKTGIVESIAPLTIRLIKHNYYLAILGITTFVGAISAFVNNTPVVATFIPIITNASRKAEQPASRYLLPLSYGAIFGGSCTLIGTSTNLLVSGIAQESGLGPFPMFLMTPMGLIFFVTGVAYLLLVGRKLIPFNRDAKSLRDDLNIKNYVSEIRVVANENGNGDQQTGKDIRSIFLKDGLAVEVNRVLRGNHVYRNPQPNFKLEVGDVLLIRGERDKMKSILKNKSLRLTESLSDRKFPGEQTKLVEIVILPNSELSGKRLDSLSFFYTYRSNVLAIRQRGKEQFEHLGRVVLRPGDVLLLQTNEEGYEALYEAERLRQAPFASMRESLIHEVDPKKLALVGLIIATMVLLASLEIVPIMIGALSAITLLLLLRIVNTKDAYQAIDWKVIVLLAGALSLGAAMDKTGLSRIMADTLVSGIGLQMGAVAVLSALYLVTTLLTEVMSNNAAAALLAPIAISIAGAIGVDPVPMLLAITFAAGASFMTPIGYQTNTMVYSAGNYRFSDFLKVGAPLNILFWIIATILIPLLHPL